MRRAPFLFIFTLLVLNQEHHTIRTEVFDEARKGTLPMEDAALIPYYFDRKKIGGFSDSDEQEEYILTATKLAFLRVHSRRLGPNRNQKKEVEIKEAREKIKKLLESRKTLASSAVSPLSA